MLIETIKFGKPTLMGAATGAVIGLVAITPGAGFVPVWASIVIGGVVSPLCFFFMTKVKPKFGYDDALDAFGCHGVGGIWGGIATGLFATKAVNGAVQWEGLFFGGDPHLLFVQLASIGITIALAVVATFVIMQGLKLIMGVKVTREEEQLGLDVSEHQEYAYPAFTGLD
jgi:Amt family ammonium transporter